MLRLRTKLLITLSGLAPASFLIIMSDFEATYGTESKGVISMGVEPSIVIKAMMFGGCIAFLLAIFSTILDVRRSRS
jgi:hypothetical protein